MSDRAQGSVRTSSRVGDSAAPKGTAPENPAPASATQAIPTTGTQRAQAADGAGAAPAGSPPVPPAGTVATGAGTSASGTAASPATAATPTGSSDTTPKTPAGTTPAGTTGTGAADTTAKTTGRAPKGRAPAKAGGRGPRRARLQLRHIDTWSALKISLALSIALFFVWMVAVGVLYLVLNGLGVFDTLNDLFGQLGSASGGSGGGSKVITLGVVFWGAGIIGAINVVLLTALCTVGAFIYNLCSDLVGGLELTLSERD